MKQSLQTRTGNIYYGPVIKNNAYQGKVYYTRKETYGWDKPGLDDSVWINSEVIGVPDGIIIEL